MSPFTGLAMDGYLTCSECGREYSADWGECPYCNSQYADHLIVRMKKDTCSSLLVWNLSHRVDVESVTVVKNMPPEHKGFEHHLCIHCRKQYVTPEQRMCKPCAESVRYR